LIDDLGGKKNKLTKFVVVEVEAGKEKRGKEEEKLPSSSSFSAAASFDPLFFNLALSKVNSPALVYKKN